MRIPILSTFLFVSFFNIGFSQTDDKSVHPNQTLILNSVSQTPLPHLQYPIPIRKDFNFTEAENFGNPYVLSADLPVPLVILNNPDSRFMATIMPRIKLRIFDNSVVHVNNDSTDASNPIRTPSFIPGVMFNYSFKAIETEENIIQPSILWSIEHHSNGQDGPVFDKDGQIDIPDRKFNIINGNFAKDIYGKVALGLTKVNFNTKLDKTSLFYDFFYRLSANDNSFWKRNYTKEKFTILSYFFELEYPIYGRQEETLGYVPAWYFSTRGVIDQYFIGKINKDFANTFSMSFNLDVALGKLNLNHPMNRVNFEYQYHFRFPFFKNTYLMLNFGYKGIDDYNIYFEDSYWFGGVGLSVKPYSIFNEQIFRKAKRMKKGL